MSVAAHIEVSLYICQLSGWNLCTYVLLHDPAAIPCIGKDQFAIITCLPVACCGLLFEFQHAWGCRFDGFWAKLFTHTDVQCITNVFSTFLNSLSQLRQTVCQYDNSVMLLGYTCLLIDNYSNSTFIRVFLCLPLHGFT